MLFHVSIPHDLEAKLRERAAEAGTDPQSFILRVVEQELRESDEPNTADLKKPASTDEWLAEFRKWVAGHKPLEHEADDSRESIYAGRGE